MWSDGLRFTFLGKPKRVFLVEQGNPMSTARSAADDGLEWSLYQNGSVCLYLRPDVLRGDLERLADRGYVVHQFAAAAWHGEADFHTALGVELALPDFAYEGRNIHAFHDRLCQIEFPSRCVLVFWGYDRFAAREARFAQWALDVFQKHSRWQMFNGKRLLTLLQSDDIALRFDPIGAYLVCWSPREAGFVHKQKWSEGRS